MRVGAICHKCKRYYRGCACPDCTTPSKRSDKYGDIYTDLVNNERWSRNLGVHPNQLKDPAQRKRLAEIHPGATFDDRTGKMQISNRKEKLQRIKERGAATGQTLVEGD